MLRSQPAHGEAMTGPAPKTTYAYRLHALLRARVRSIAVFIALMTLFDLSRAWSMSDLPSGMFQGMTAIPRTNWILLIVASFAPHLVEAASARGMRRILLTAFTTFFLVGVAALVIDILAEGSITWGVQAGRVLSNEAFLVRGWWLYSVAGLLFAAYCQARDRELATVWAAQTAELERADSQRNIVASRLQVLQARVEPELLFGALGDVTRTYLLDPAAAEALLDDLIAYLRAALPQMRGGPSTLLREAALAEAYLKVVPAGRSGGLVADVRIADGLGTTPFPPLVLLPLAHAATEVESRAIHISAPATGTALSAGMNSLAIRVVTPEIPKGWEEAQLPGIRGSLQHYFGAEASLQIERAGDSVSAVMIWRAVDALTPPSTKAASATA
jgi:hypothetical protein